VTAPTTLAETWTAAQADAPIDPRATPERAECARAWFAERYADPAVFVDGAEALTLEAACQLVADAQAAERERWTQMVQQVLDANADAPPSVLLTPRQECAWDALRLFMAARSEGPNVGAKLTARQRGSA
jgi:hypothetical protein